MRSRKRSPSDSASSTVVPDASSVITESDAWEIEQPWPSHVIESMRGAPSAADTATRSVTSSPHVGLSWWDSPHA